MRKKFTFNSIVNSNRIMMVFSLLMSILIWAVVNYVISAGVERSIHNVPVTVDISNEMWGTYLNMAVFGEDQFTVTVTVSGGRWQVEALDAGDFQIKPNYDSILPQAGVYEINLSAVRTSNRSGFDIVSVEPASVSVYCSTKATKTFPLEVNADGVSPEEDSGRQIGVPVLRSVGAESGNIEISGPSDQIAQIRRVVTRIREPKKISQMETFTADIVALDSDGREVNLQYCTFSEFNDREVSVLVPVLLNRTIEFQYTLLNVPDALKEKEGFFELNPARVTITGEPGLVEEAAKTMGDLGTFDFQNVRLNSHEFIRDINVPQGITVVDGHKIAVLSVDMADMTEKKINLPLSLPGNTTVQNLPEGNSATLSSTVISEVVLVGRTSSINRIREANLKVEVDVADNAVVGTYQYNAHISVEGYSDVWVCLPENGEKYSVWLSIG